MIFFSDLKGKRELETILREMRVCLENNYKEPAHRERQKLGERTEALYRDGRIREKTYRHYKTLYEEYTIRLKDYHH